MLAEYGHTTDNTVIKREAEARNVFEAGKLNTIIEIKEQGAYAESCS